MPWKPGESGNPNGRPKRLAQLSAKICEMEPRLLERLARIAFDGEDKDANTAIKTLLAYGWGAPFQPIGGEDGGPIMTRNDDLAALVHEIAERRQLGK